MQPASLFISERERTRVLTCSVVFIDENLKHLYRTDNIFLAASLNAKALMISSRSLAVKVGPDSWLTNLSYPIVHTGLFFALCLSIRSPDARNRQLILAYYNIPAVRKH
jgi:hypothetical protein